MKGERERVCVCVGSCLVFSQVLNKLVGIVGSTPSQQQFHGIGLVGRQQLALGGTLLPTLQKYAVAWARRTLSRAVSSAAENSSACFPRRLGSCIREFAHR
jgi:hypothetical protein